MKRTLVLFLLSLGVFTHGVQATLVKFSYSGLITEVQNQGDDLWDPTTLIGSAISGYVILDTSADIRGRAETTWYWWDINDNGPGYLNSFVQFEGFEYRLTNQYDYDAIEGIYLNNEALGVNDGPGYYDDTDVGDVLSLKDNERKEGQFTDTQSVHHKILSVSFRDYVNDILSFPGDFTDATPDFTQQFTWTDMDLEDPDQRGGGYFEFSQLVNESGEEVYVDSELEFVLTQMSSSLVDAEIPAPGSLGLICLGLVIWWRYRRQSQFHDNLPALSAGRL